MSLLNTTIRRKVVLLLLSSSLFIHPLTNAQSWNVAEPTDGSGATGTDVGKGICTDAAGNVYIIGVFNGTADFNFNSSLVNSVSSVGNDGFIASYDKDGNYRWHTVISGTGSDMVSPSGAICTDGTNVWFTGAVNIAGTPHVISGSNNVTIVSTGGSGSEIVVGKLACSDGAVNWVREFGGLGSNDGGEGICIDPSKNCYVIGSYGGTFTLDAISPGAAGGSADLFIAKFDAAGTMTNVAKGGSSTGADMLSNGGSICYVPGASPAIVAVGSCANGGTITYGGFSTASSGSIDAVLLELDLTLNFTNALVLGTSTAATDELLGVTYDPFSGGVYVSGYYNGGTITLPGTSAMTNSGIQDIMVARYSVAANNFTWAAHAGGTGDERGESITANGHGGILVSGNTGSAPCSFGGTVSVSSSAIGLNDLYIARYNTTGTADWAIATGGSTGDDQARGVASYVQTTSSYVQNVYTTGNFQNTVTFNATSLVSDGGSDVFFARLNDPTFLLPLKLVSFTGSRQNDFTNRLQWQTAEEMNTGGFIIEKSPDGKRYDSLARVAAGLSGEHAYSYEDHQGSTAAWYRLKMIDIDGNFTYSEALFISSRDISGKVSVSPNPASAWFQLHATAELVNTTAIINNVNGALVKRVVIKDLYMIIDIPELLPGMYFIKFRNGKVLKLVKER